MGTGALSNAELYQQVRIERERLASITLNIGEGVCAIAADGSLTFVNPAAADLIDLPALGVDGDQAPERAVAAPAYLLRPAREAMRTRATIREDDARFRGRDGAAIPVAYTVSPVMRDGLLSGAVITFRDITERKAFEDELHHYACYDDLTGLANRRLLVDRLDQALQRSTLDSQTHALIFVDVDRFKSINDSLGHVTGDEFLVAIAGRMKSVVRAGDLIARFGGDEFVMLLEDVAGEDEAVSAAQRICAAVERPLELSGGYEMVATVSVGIADDRSPGRPPMTCSAMPTWPCMRPRPGAAAGSTGCSTRSRWEPARPSGFRSRPTCARASSEASSTCIISRSTHWTESTSWARRRSCGGVIPPTA